MAEDNKHAPSTTSSCVRESDGGPDTLGRPIWKIRVLLLLGLFHFLVTWFMMAPGYLVIDELVYHRMAKDFLATGSFELRTGYREFPSIELSHRHMPVRRGRVVSTYPYLYSVLAAPFYSLGGISGLIAMNALAFPLAVVLCFLTARRLFNDENLAADSCLVLVLCTFAWEYSQAVWPHATAMALVIAAFYLMVRSYTSETRGPALAWAFASGLAAGFSPGLRMDSFLAMPGLILPFLFARPWRPVEAVAFVLGTFPGIGLLTATNYWKFGIASPISYGWGRGIEIPYWALGVLVAALLLAWIVTRPWGPKLEGRRLKAAALVVIALGLLVSSAPWARERVLSMGANACVALLDTRALDEYTRMPSLLRTAGGAMVYLGSVKKSLLQSLPFLPILLIPIVRLFRNKESSAPLLTLLTMPITFMAYYSYSSHEFGGLCLNMRYFLSVLPFIAILCAFAIRTIRTEWGVRLGPVANVLTVSLTAGLFFVEIFRSEVTASAVEFSLLVLPLIMAATLSFLVTAGELISTEGARSLRGGAWVALLVSLTWSGLVAFLYDYPRHRGQRVSNYSVLDKTLSYVLDNSVFFSYPYFAPSLVEGEGIRIAFPHMDKGKDLPKLVDHQLREGGRAFAIFGPQMWEKLKAGQLKRYKITPMVKLPDGAYLAEIESSTNGAGS